MPLSGVRDLRSVKSYLPRYLGWYGGMHFRGIRGVLAPFLISLLQKFRMNYATLTGPTNSSSP